MLELFLVIIAVILILIVGRFYTNQVLEKLETINKQLKEIKDTLK